MDFERYFEKEYEYLPWIELSEKEKDEQAKWQEALCKRYNMSLGRECVISTQAHIYGVSQLSLGRGTMVGSHSIFRQIDMECGEECSFNSYSVIQGKIRLGDYVRIAPGAKLFGENHGFSSLDEPICKQPCTQKGIEIGDDVWIGADAVITDGVKIGSHSIIGAGAVVTHDVPQYSICAGVPAVVVKNRTDDLIDDDFKEKIVEFGNTVRKNAAGILEGYFDGDGYRAAENDGEKNRAVCDAVEIATMLGCGVPYLDRDTIVKKIRSFQRDEEDYQSVLSASYALECLGEKPIEFRFVKNLGTAFFKSLPWDSDAWNAGHRMDIYATARYFNYKYYNGEIPGEMFYYLAYNICDDGLWGKGDMLLRVNGFYRAERGSFAQFGCVPPLAHRTVKTVLKHSKNIKKPTACEALDIIHPLWVNRERAYSNEAKFWCIKNLPIYMARLQSGGFAFEFEGEPSLKGTEMWLSIIYLMCDYLGLSSLLGYEPKGVHRT